MIKDEESVDKESTIKDIEFTLGKLESAYKDDDESSQHKYCCKIPDTPIFCSLKFFKMILRETNEIEKVFKTAPDELLIIRKRLGVESAIGMDDIIKFVLCLQWLWKDASEKVLEDIKSLQNNGVSFDAFGDCLKEISGKSVEELIGKEIGEFQKPSKQDEDNYKKEKIFEWLVQHFENENDPKKKTFFKNNFLENGIPKNFFNFLLISLDHDNKKFERTAKKDNKNIGKNLIVQYDYDQNYEAILK
jgi:hypothetical protein